MKSSGWDDLVFSKHICSRTLKEEVALKLADPSWLIKVKYQQEVFQKDAARDLKRDQVDTERMSVPLLETRRERRGKEKERKDNTRADERRAKKPKRQESDDDEAIHRQGIFLIPYLLGEGF
eukprot:s1017_g2.t2